jgi:hypothetical protein
MNQAVSTLQYTLQDGDAERDRDVVIPVWRGSLGSEARMTAKYDWFYRRCPYGAPIVQLLREESQSAWVGVCTAGRRQMMVNGDVRATAVVVDLAVVEGHRSLGPALALQQGLVSRARKQVDMLLGFPNPRAVPMFKRAGHERFTDLVRYARVLRHAPYLGERMPRWPAVVLGAVVDGVCRLREAVRRLAGARVHVEWSTATDPRMDALWQDSRPTEMLTAVRDERFVRWRFDDSPLVDSRHLLLSRTPGGPLEGWFTVERRGNALHVLDAWSRDMDAGVPPAHVDALLREATRMGCVSVSVELATQPERLRAWTSRGFVARGSRPVFRTWSRDGRPPEAGGYHLTAADEDE